MSGLFSFAASITLVFVMIAYFRQAHAGGSTPNPATWIIWFLADALNAETYAAVVKGDPWMMTMPVFVAVSMGFSLAYWLVKGKFTKLASVEWITLGGVLLIGLYRAGYTAEEDRVTANLLLQVIFLISFIPTIAGLLRKRGREEPFAWFLAMLAYSFQIGAVVSASHVRLEALAYPIVNGIVGNGIVAWIAWFQKRAKCSPAA